MADRPVMDEMQDGRRTLWHGYYEYAWALPVPDSAHFFVTRIQALTRSYAVHRRNLPAVDGWLWLIVVPRMSTRAAIAFDETLKEEYKKVKLGFNPIVFSRLLVAANNLGVSCDPNKLIDVLRRVHSRGGYPDVH